MFTYEGNDNETYYIFKDGKKFAEMFTAEYNVEQIVELLNTQYEHAE